MAPSNQIMKDSALIRNLLLPQIVVPFIELCECLLLHKMDTKLLWQNTTSCECSSFPPGHNSHGSLWSSRERAGESNPNSIHESCPLTVDCNASEVAITATLIQGGGGEVAITGHLDSYESIIRKNMLANLKIQSGHHFSRWPPSMVPKYHFNHRICLSSRISMVGVF